MLGAMDFGLLLPFLLFIHTSMEMTYKTLLYTNDL
nr:MAG TPA: hypothetical protein [Crassvirales sp.]